MTIERVSPPDQMNPECKAPSGGPCICGRVVAAGAKGATFANPMPTADYIVKPALRRADGVVDARSGLVMPFLGAEIVAMLEAAESTNTYGDEDRYSESARILHDIRIVKSKLEPTRVYELSLDDLRQIRLLGIAGFHYSP